MSNHVPANAVARLDNLEFLSDVVPRTTTYKKWSEEKSKRDTATKAAAPSKLPNGQTTIGRSSESSGLEAIPSNGIPPSTPRLNQDAERMQVDVSPVKSEYWDPTAQSRSPPNRRHTLEHLTNGSGDRPVDSEMMM